MASDRQQFNRAQAKWEQLGRDKYFSVSAELGGTAIITSSFTDEEPGTAEGISELSAFRSEALALADRVHGSGGMAELAINATRGDITSLIQDPDVATLYLIGNGSLSSLLLDVKDYYDWSSVAEATTHLKQGCFIQRQCGNFSRNLNVPLGLFAVSDPRNVHAATGEEFYPANLDDIENQKIRPVFVASAIDYEAIKNLPMIEKLDVMELKDLAYGQPKINDAVDVSQVSNRTYRDFYKRFPEIKAVVEGSADRSEIIYVRTVKERFGVDLLDFYSKHPRLCDDICEAIEAKRPYDRLVEGRDRLKSLEMSGVAIPVTADELDVATGHPLGIDAIGMYYWGRINPLLKKAYALLGEMTLNVPFLTR